MSFLTISEVFVYNCLRKKQSSLSFRQWHNKNTLILNRTSNHLYSKKSFLLKISTQILWPIMAYVERHKYLYNILTQLPNVFIVTDRFRFLAVYSLYKC